MKRMNDQTCMRCIMDTTAENIVFDSDGHCNYCHEFLIKQDKNNYSRKWDKLIETIKWEGKGKRYDCIVGVSGGVDSSYTLHLAKSHGLRPLAVHMDNGWDSELAQNNIANLVKQLQIDLYTHVIDWKEYKALMQAFFDADVIDIELLYDNAMIAVNYQQAAQYGLRYILSGSNCATEGIRIPSNWNTFKLDKKNIYSLAKKSKVKIKTFPTIGTIGYAYARLVKKIQWIFTLDYVDYQKEKSVQFLQSNYGFKPYPYKHYESLFTRFYQGFILPTKFGVDKRKAHFSSLILNGQMNRSDAIRTIEEAPYPNQQHLEMDLAYFLKKMEWSKQDLESYLQRSAISHDHYGSEYRWVKQLEKIWRIFQH